MRYNGRMTRNILLIATASVACFKAAEVVRGLRARGGGAQVMLSPNAQKMVGAATFRALSGQPVLVDEWRRPDAPDGMDHIAAVRRADALLVAPATADFIAKAAHGICENLPLAAFAAADIPKFIAPAMNAKMWQNPANSRNVAQLVQDGVYFLGPDSGEQACGEFGLGRMMEPDDIVSQLLAKLGEKSPLSGKKIVVNAGATVEKVDPMRVITNLSSGKMGFAVAEAIRRAGGEAVVVAAQTSAPPPEKIRIVRAPTGEEMRTALLAETADADAFIAVAAIADFRPKRVAIRKIPRSHPPSRSDGENPILELVPAPDILAEIAKSRPNLFCVGFAAETGNSAKIIAAARRKMLEKGVPLIVANDASDAGRDDCQITIVSSENEESIPRQPKSAAARILVDRVAARIVSRETEIPTVENSVVSRETSPNFPKTRRRIVR